MVISSQDIPVRIITTVGRGWEIKIQQWDGEKYSSQPQTITFQLKHPQRDIDTPDIRILADSNVFLNFDSRPYDVDDENNYCCYRVG